MTSRLNLRVASRPIEPVLRRMRTLAPLSPAEQALVASLGQGRERHAAGEELVAEGQPPRRARFVVSGWACHQRLMSDGRRQIFGFILPGDGFGLAGQPDRLTITSVVALTALETIDAEPVVEAARSDEAPGLKLALEHARRATESLLLDHVVRLGRQTAYERVAHFMLELQHRLEIAGVGDANRFPLPLTQEILADALGLSIVHVNRTLQQLRRERLIELRGGVAILLQPDLLASIADYRRLSSAEKISA